MKVKLFKIVYSIKKIVVGLFFSFSLNQYLNSQTIIAFRQLYPDNPLNVDSLSKEYTINKKFFPGYELPTITALSYYPELKNTRIEFVSKSIKTTMACRPKWNFFLSRRENRVYKIYINNDKNKIKGAMLADVPYNAQVGLIGHELGHVTDYAQSGVFGIIGMGIKYLFTTGKARIEKRVDKITIDHQLGWQLYDFCDFVFNRSTVSDEYKNYKRKVYYKPEDILQLMQRK